MPHNCPGLGLSRALGTYKDKRLQDEVWLFLRDFNLNQPFFPGGWRSPYDPNMDERELLVTVLQGGGLWFACLEER